jgi:hypothetical protein
MRIRMVRKKKVSKDGGGKQGRKTYTGGTREIQYTRMYEI